MRGNDVSNLRRILKCVDAISEWSGRCVMFTIWVALALVVWEVTARYAFNHPSMWAPGTAQRIFAAYYILAGTYVLRHRAHIRVDVIYRYFPVRVKATIDLIGIFCLFVFCGVLLWQGLGFAWTSLINLEPDVTPWRAPVYPVKMLIPIGAFLVLLQGSVNFIRTVITVVTGNEYKS